MSTTEPTDDDLMRLVACDDHSAFAAIVTRYQTPLLNFFLRMGAHSDEADDLAQEAFVRLYRYRRRYRPEGRFVSFLYTLARHARADMLRRSKRSTEIGTDSLPEAPDTARPHDAATQEKLDVERALNMLSEKLRSVVVLSVFHGMEYQDIGQILDIPVGTVKSRMHLAMRALKEAFDADTSEASGS